MSREDRKWDPNPISEFEITVWAATPKAVLCGDKEADAVWIPRSLIEGDPPEAGCCGWIAIPEWLARKNGWE